MTSPDAGVLESLKDRVTNYGRLRTTTKLFIHKRHEVKGAKNARSRPSVNTPLAESDLEADSAL